MFSIEGRKNHVVDEPPTQGGGGTASGSIQNEADSFASNSTAWEMVPNLMDSSTFLMVSEEDLFRAMPIAYED